MSLNTSSPPVHLISSLVHFKLWSKNWLFLPICEHSKLLLTIQQCQNIGLLLLNKIETISGVFRILKTTLSGMRKWQEPRTTCGMNFNKTLSMSGQVFKHLSGTEKESRLFAFSQNLVNFWMTSSKNTLNSLADSMHSAQETTFIFLN